MIALIALSAAAWLLFPDRPVAFFLLAVSVATAIALYARRRGVAAILGLVVVAWVALRWVAPTVLGWPQVDCGPTECGNWEAVWSGAPIDALLPITNVTIEGVGECQTTALFRYFGGFERTIEWIC